MAQTELEKMREQIEKDTKSFLESGGKIQTVPIMTRADVKAAAKIGKGRSASISFDYKGEEE